MSYPVRFCGGRRYHAETELRQPKAPHWRVAKTARDCNDDIVYMARRRSKKLAYHHGDLRRVLIDTAIDWVAREGTGSISLRELAQSLGVSHAAPYRHFRNKETLFAAVASEGFRLLADAMIAARDLAAANARVRLIAIGVGYVEFAVAHPGHFKVMFSQVGRPPADAPGVALEGAEAFKVLLSSIHEGQAAGELRRGDPMQLALVAWSGVHGLATLHIERCLAPLGFTESAGADARQLVALLLSGIGAIKN